MLSAFGTGGILAIRRQMAVNAVNQYHCVNGSCSADSFLEEKRAYL